MRCCRSEYGGRNGCGRVTYALPGNPSYIRMSDVTGSKWICSVALLAGLFATAQGASAQTAIYGEFTGGKVPAANTALMFGPTVGFYHDNGLGLIALGYDVRGTFLRRGDTHGRDSNQSLNLIDVGVRLAVTPHVLPIKPYVEALGGYGGLTGGQGAARQDGSHVNYELLGGVDLTFFPRLDWRVVEFSYTRLSGVPDAFAPKALSTGLVFRLP